VIAITNFVTNLITHLWPLTVLDMASLSLYKPILYFWTRRSLLLAQSSKKLHVAHL